MADYTLADDNNPFKSPRFRFLMEQADLIRYLEGFQKGDVLRYRLRGSSEDRYLIVSKISGPIDDDTEGSVILGCIASPIGVNSISVERLVEEADFIEKARFDRFT